MPGLAAIVEHPLVKRLATVAHPMSMRTFGPALNPSSDIEWSANTLPIGVRPTLPGARLQRSANETPAPTSLRPQKLCADDHQREAEKVQSAPLERVLDLFIVRSETDAPNSIDWAGLHENPLAGGDEKVSKTTGLRELRQVTFNDDVAPLSVPDALIESAEPRFESDRGWPPDRSLASHAWSALYRPRGVVRRTRA